MKRRNNTKKALLTSVLSLLLCCSMLIGTTFAWFTDSVSSGMNRIMAGNLDLEVYYENENKELTSIETVEKLFEDVTLWEPGAVAYENLTVANEGTLALKYQLGVTYGNQNTVDGYGLSGVLQAAIVENGVDTTKDRDEIVAGISDWQKLSDWYVNGELVPEKDATAEAPSSVTYGIVIWWEPSENDNNWNVNNGKRTSDGEPLHIDLGISANAWQRDYENDSFGIDYDANLVTTTLAELQERIAQNQDAVLMGVNEPSAVIEIPAAYTGTVTLNNVSIASIQAEGDADIVVDGKVTVKAVEADSSAISANGKLNISGTGNLTAVANGLHAYGIGGPAATEINISDITVDYVAGGSVGQIGTDEKYYKDAAEGGSAIGSGYDGAVITLNGVTVGKAIGGSKAAGIGASYWTGVTVNIIDSTIGYVEGGATAAGIGGSRISNGATTDENVKIQIENSTVTAQGGAYGAGIGSGYDTHCQAPGPICTINITGNSVINATGGKYAAGIGTGYHNAGLDGTIAESVVVNAASGEKLYKDTYTTAMDIGFGVVDPAREGLNNSCSINYKGTEIGIPAVTKSVSTAQELADALASGEKTINISGQITLTAGLSASDVTFVGMTADSGIDFAGHNITGSGTITYQNLQLTTVSLPNIPENGERYGWYGGIDYVRHSVANYENCTIEGVFTLYSDTVNVTGCTFNPYVQDGEEFYHIFVYGSDVVNVEGCTFYYGDRSIKIYTEDTTAQIEMTVSNCEFKAAEGAKINKALINIDSTLLKSVKLTIENITVDTALAGVATYSGADAKVTVTEK